MCRIHYQIFICKANLLQNCFAGSTSVTGSLLLTAETRFLAMDQSQKIILTPFNFFEWKAEMEILLRVKGLYRVTMATEAELNAAAKKIKWHNRRDEAYGLLCLSISRDLLFHVDGLTSPNEVWENIVDIFGKTDEMRGHQIDNEMI